MPHINYQGREIVFKIVYYGPGLSGKTTNLVHIHRTLEENIRGDIVTLDTEEERTLFFDFFPLELGEIESFKVRFNMYTVPGQIFYEASRRLILDGADGIVFVADSNAMRLDDNIVSFEMMEGNLESYGVDWHRFPIALQYNKRDCPDPLPLGSLESELDLNGIPVYEAVAIRGAGVMETIRGLSRMVIEQFRF
jgi:mutual gliding-motility protein MglA